MLRVALFTGALHLSGCGPEVMAEALYPGGQVVALRSSDGEPVMQYGCAPEGPGGKTVTERAAAAHRYFEAELDRFGDRMVDKMMADIENDVSEDAFTAKLISDSEAFADKTGAEMNKRFACAYLNDQ
jgi:hypothetical protein